MPQSATIDANPAEVTAGHHRPRVPHEGVAGVAVIDGANPAVGARGADDLCGFLERGRERFLAQHVEVGLQEGPGDLEMGAVGGCDRDQRHAIGPRPFPLEHLAPITVGAILRDP
jgi:hypothetical protein